MSTQVIASATSNLRGATGLSREALAAWYRSAGLFGTESSLNAAEQAVVQNQFGPIVGLRSRALLAPVDARLQALATYTRELIAADGVDTREDVAQLVAQGYSHNAAWEVARLVRNVREVFGLKPRVADVQLTTLATRSLQRAA